MDTSHFGDFPFAYDALSQIGTLPDAPLDQHHPAQRSSVDQSGLLAASLGSGHNSLQYDDTDLSALQSSVPTPGLTNTSTAPNTNHSSSSFMMDPTDFSIMDPLAEAMAEFTDALSPDAAAAPPPPPPPPPVHHSMVDNNTHDEYMIALHDPADGTDLGSKVVKDDAAPAWSELKTKAGKERKRLPLACIACRRKKIRCSGEKPACKHCLRSRIPCVYKVTSRKAAPRTDYMAMLDKRLKRMEERIIKIVPEADGEANGGAPTVTRAVVKPALPGVTRKRRADEAFEPSFDALVNGGGPRGDGSSANAMTIDHRDAQNDFLIKEGAEALPPKAIQEHLSEVFFDCVYGQPYCLLHKPSYMRKLR